MITLRAISKTVRLWFGATLACASLLLSNSASNAEPIGAKTNSTEALPKKDAPGKNWGAVTNGFQLGLHFEKQVFKVGERITADVVLRNATNRTLPYLVLRVMGRGVGPIEFAVTRNSGSTVPENPPGEVFAGSTASLSPGDERTYQLPLEKRFIWGTNETYTVQALWEMKESIPTSLESGKVTIRIEE